MSLVLDRPSSIRHPSAAKPTAWRAGIQAPKSGLFLFLVNNDPKSSTGWQKCQAGLETVSLRQMEVVAIRADKNYVEFSTFMF